MCDEPVADPDDEPARQIDLQPIDSVAMQRLIAEVRQRETEGPFDTTLYNRTYHRHNR